MSIDSNNRRKDERREDTRREDSEGERRKIPRFTDHDIVSNLTQSRTLFKILFFMTPVFALTEVGFSYYEGSRSYTEGFVWAMGFIILGFILKRVLFVVGLYLENHSVKNLERVHDSFMPLFSYLTFVVILVFIIRIIIRT